MLDVALKSLPAVALSLVVGLWAVVTTDHWPLDDKKLPATAVWKVNRLIGKWLADHAEPAVPCFEAPSVGPEPLTAAELAQVKKQIAAMPTHDKIKLPKTRNIVPGPVGASVDLSTGAGGGGGGRLGSSGGGGSCGTASRG